LDFYDSKNVTNQQIYLTIIIPTRQGETLSTTYGRKTVKINKPTFSLDFTGNKEGYFVYWLKSTEFINLSTLYMSAKFFDANTGQFKRLMTKSQGDLIDKFNFNQSDYFYYTVNLNYDNYTYSIYLDTIGGDKNRVGTTSLPVKWYEYVNYVSSQVSQPEISVTPSVTPTLTPSVTPTLTPSVTPTLTPSVTPTLTPSVTPTLTPSVTPTLTPSVTPTLTPSVTPTLTPSVTPTLTPTPSSDVITLYIARVLADGGTIESEDCLRNQYNEL
jgi:hypothetical protein